MIGALLRNWGEIRSKLFFFVQLLKEVTRFNDTIRDGLNVGMAHNFWILPLQTNGRRRFGTNDETSFTSEFGEDLHIFFRQLASRFEIACRDVCHTGANLSRRHMQLQAVMLDDSSECISQFGIMIVGEMIDKVDDGMRIAQRNRRRRPITRRTTDKWLSRDRRKLARPGDAEQSFH